MLETTYSHARANLARLLDRVTKDRETVLIGRRGGEKVAMIAEADLSSLLETVYLLRSPRNAERLLAALTRARKGIGRPMSLERLRHEVGLGEKGA
jgi:antitoxin YefM